MQSCGSVRIDTVERVGWVYVRWPASQYVNAAVLEALQEVLNTAEDADVFSALVFVQDSARTGEGGADASSAAPHQAEPCDLELLRKWEKLVVRLDRLSCATVAAVDGPCSGSWLQLALACDHRVASERTVFQVKELKDGMLPGMNVFRLAKFMGLGAARNLIFTGRKVGTQEAIRLGIVDESCDDSCLAERVRSFLQLLDLQHGVALQLARRLLNESFHAAFDDLIGHYLASQHRCASELDKLRAGGA